MNWHIVIKHLKCLKCNIVIQARKVRTTQGADTPEDKALQDLQVGSFIKRKHGLPGCPKCKRGATICDTDGTPNAMPNDTRKENERLAADDRRNGYQSDSPATLQTEIDSLPDGHPIRQMDMSKWTQAQITEYFKSKRGGK